MKVSSSELRKFIESEGYEAFGFVSLERTVSADLFDHWVDQGFHGEMKYLEDSKERRRNPRQVWPEMRSAVVFTLDYIPHPRPVAGPLSSQGVALYARGEDYHHFLKVRLNKLTEVLKEKFPGESIVFTDSAPILEREWAVRAGLGWIGKNSCLIHKKRGSFFFIAEILTSLEITEMEEYESVDHCGKCRKCIEACPTQAISEERVLDSSRCISYLTIEAKSVAPLELRDKMSSYLFGCDICQVVCPWNIKFSDGELMLESRMDVVKDASQTQIPVEHRWRLKQTKDLEQLKKDVVYILSSSSKKLQKDLFTTAISRSAGLKLKRNALYIVAEQKWTELRPLVEPLSQVESLNELATWCLNQLTDAVDQTTGV